MQMYSIQISSQQLSSYKRVRKSLLVERKQREKSNLLTLHRDDFPFQLTWLRSKIIGSDNQAKPYRAFESLFDSSMAFVLTWAGERTDTFRNKIAWTTGIKQLLVEAVEKETSFEDWTRRTRASSMAPNAIIQYPTAERWVV
jgi:hypothetical protein